MGFGTGDQFFLCLGCFDLHQEMNTCFFPRDLDQCVQITFFDCVDQSVSLGMVIISQAIDVLFKIPFFYKFGKRILLKVGDCAGIKGKFVIKFVQQCFWKHHIADADSGSERFGKGIHIDDFVGNIDALQSWDWLPA